MLKNIKTVIYERNFALSAREYFRLDIYEDKNVLQYSNSKYINTKIENVNNDLVMQYLEQLFRIVDGWKNKYENNEIVDGIGWNLEVTYKNGEKKQYFGKNDVPSNFEYLDEIKHEMINKVLENKV